MTDHARDFETMLTAMRPTLHRYCARMTGSAVDGEDVVQDAMIKAVCTENHIRVYQVTESAKLAQW